MCTSFGDVLFCRYLKPLAMRQIDRNCFGDVLFCRYLKQSDL